MAGIPTTCGLAMPVPRQGSNLQVTDDRLEALTRASWKAKARQKVNRNMSPSCKSSCV
ncbi:Hypothetical predicted protein, partial [Paramuricea clavata]